MKAIFAALFLMTIAAAPVSASCIVPSVASAHIDNVSHDGNLNHYRVAITLSNKTSGVQASNTLQFIDIYHARQRLDAIGVPPLRAGASYQAFYTFTRAGDAGDGTTTLYVRMRMVQPLCGAAPATTVTF